MYYEQHDFIYTLVPRTASSSLSILLGSSAGHTPLKEYKTHFQKTFRHLNWEGTFKFAFVRHPYERFISSYRLLGGEKREINRALADWGHIGLIIKNDHTMFRPMVDYLCDDEGKLMIDWFGRFESLQDDWKQIVKRFNIKGELTHRNKSKGKKPKLNNRSKEMIYKIYEKDFKTFGYES